MPLTVVICVTRLGCRSRSLLLFTNAHGLRYLILTTKIVMLIVLHGVLAAFHLVETVRVCHILHFPHSLRAGLLLPAYDPAMLAPLANREPFDVYHKVCLTFSKSRMC